MPLIKRVYLKKLGHGFSIIAAFIWNLMPWSFNLYMAKFLAFLWIDIFRIRRDILLSNLRIVYPEHSEKELLIIAKKSMIALCRSFFDVIRIPYLKESWIKKNVVVHGEEIFKQIQESKQGVLFLCMHIGSGDLLGAIVSSQHVPITLISKRFKNQFMDAFWFGLRERSKTEFINSHSKNNAYEILAALKKQRGVVFVMDQFMGKPYGVESKFFGVTTGTAYGLALFAQKTRKPIYPLYNYWDNENRFHVCIDPAVDLSAELSETNEVITNKFNKVIEDIILKYPEHWMWVHKRWKTFE